MNVNQEQERHYWRCLLSELQSVMTMAEIAEALGVSDRIVWRWKTGDRPTGMNAVRVYLLHVKRCQASQCPIVHVQGATK